MKFARVLAREIRSLVKKHPHIQFIVLYGSFAIGKQKKWSDVDIGIYYKGKHIPHSSRILNLDRYRLISLICRDADKVAESLTDPYEWIYFAKRIQASKLLYQKGNAFRAFKRTLTKLQPKPVQFHRYTSKFLADILEYLGKTKNATSELSRKHNAKIVAIACFWLLSPINQIKPYDPKKELEFYLQLKNKPKSFNNICKRILLERYGRGFVQDVLKLVILTIKYAEKKRIFENGTGEDWYKVPVRTGKIYELLK